ncbi:hypothetical protein [Alienimonas chondri]|uniref:Uncharacterized protein n=1 Tax=Alienimonas chondri TaxID=2681879 RepID=A0ABX1VHQ7_9PLAN|nr:hypothetical protein [Alienimonas chondri]NNJ26798.1 hypothetical protein [Alienimonas chondri]
MTLKGFLTYSLLTNITLAGAVLWQEQVRADVLEYHQSAAIDEDVIFREYVARELATQDPERIEGVQKLCQTELTKLKPQIATIWDPRD